MGRPVLKAVGPFINWAESKGRYAERVPHTEVLELAQFTKSVDRPTKGAHPIHEVFLDELGRLRRLPSSDAYISGFFSRSKSLNTITPSLERRRLLPDFVRRIAEQALKGLHSSDESMGMPPIRRPPMR